MACIFYNFDFEFLNTTSRKQLVLWRDSVISEMALPPSRTIFYIFQHLKNRPSRNCSLSIFYDFFLGRRVVKGWFLWITRKFLTLKQVAEWCSVGATFCCISKSVNSLSLLSIFPNFEKLGLVRIIVKTKPFVIRYLTAQNLLACNIFHSWQ